MMEVEKVTSVLLDGGLLLRSDWAENPEGFAM
jgi:hypothetical protein